MPSSRMLKSAAVFFFFPSIFFPLLFSLFIFSFLSSLCLFIFLSSLLCLFFSFIFLLFLLPRNWIPSRVLLSLHR